MKELIKKWGISIILMLFTIDIYCQSKPSVYTPDKQYEIIEYTGLGLGWVKGKVSVYYKKALKTQLDYNKITRPFIMVEGFDPSGGNTAEAQEGLYGTYGTLFENLRADGWDVILLDLVDNQNKIQDNGMLMRKLILDINSQVQSNHDTYGTDIYHPTIMGFSMGGLICRYALCKLEAEGKNHMVDNMICYDSPHKGANVPLGFQSLLPDVLSKSEMMYAALPDWFQQIRPGYWINKLISNNIGVNYLSESAIQMSLNYTSDNDVRKDFLDEFESLGKYPQKCRKIGVADGSNGISMAKPAWVDKNLLYWHGGLCLADWSWGNFNMRYCPYGFGIDVYRVPGAIIPPNAVSMIGAGKDIGVLGASVWLLPGTIFPSPYQWVKTSLNMDYKTMSNYNFNPNVDLVPGSFIKAAVGGMASLQELVANSPKIDASIPLKIDIPQKCWGKKWWRMCIGPITLIDTKIPIKFNPAGRVDYKPFTFVPTVSALDVKTNDFDLWYYDVSKLGRYPNGNKTPFDVVAYSDINRNHTDSYPRARIMIQDEVSPVNLFIQNKTFSSGYINTFQARKNILLGNNVDYRTDSSNTAQKRVPVGNVVLGSNSNVTLVCGENDFIYFEDGFETSNDFTGELTTKTYTYSQDYQAEYFNPVTKDTSHVNDGYGVPILPVANKYSTLRTSASSTQSMISPTKANNQLTSNANTSNVSSYNPVNDLVSKLPNPNEGKFDESAADAKHKAIYEQTVAQAYQSKSYIRPNPIVNDITNLFFTLNNTSVVTVKIYDINGREKLQISLGSFNEGLNQTKLDLSALNEGNYICQVITASYTEMHKFVKK